MKGKRKQRDSAASIGDMSAWSGSIGEAGAESESARGAGVEAGSTGEVSAGVRSSRLEVDGKPSLLEDRVLKYAAYFFGKELLALLGVKGRIARIAQTEQIHLEMKSFSEDFNFEMEDGSWCHFEFESDDITENDLRRFRVYEAITAYYHKVEVTTYVLCTSAKKDQRTELRCGDNVYRVNLIRIRDEDAEEAMKFVPEDRLQNLREVLNMTAFGQIMFGDAIEQGMQRGMQQGLQQGIQTLIETCQEFGKTREETLSRVMQKFSLSGDVVAEYMKKYWKA